MPINQTTDGMYGRYAVFNGQSLFQLVLLLFQTDLLSCFVIFHNALFKELVNSP